MKGISILLNKWDMRYLQLAEEVANWSKDPSTKIGAIAVGAKGQVLSQGYNGFPRGIDDHVDLYKNRETKYKYVVHAEMNVIYNATYHGICLEGSTLYVTGLPVCSDCAKGIIQVGISRVVMKEHLTPQKWVDSWKTTSQMFDQVNIKWEFINVSNTGMA
jgi:dCMP deaminase|tara:strand:- start:288 stop:767 length:480 start_codon:yes stop_codon:yes gene_type:complete